MHLVSCTRCGGAHSLSHCTWPLLPSSGLDVTQLRHWVTRFVHR